jgi:hypothetical protein
MNHHSNYEDFMNTLLSANVIDIRDLFRRFEYLENELADDGKAATRALVEGETLSGRNAEYEQLRLVFEDLAGRGGGFGSEEEWRGFWFPWKLISRDYFTEYNKQLTIECGYVPDSFPDFLAIQVDWEKTAQNCLSAYRAVDIFGKTYVYRKE